MLEELGKDQKAPGSHAGPTTHLALAPQEGQTYLERVNLEAERAQCVLNLLLQPCDLRVHSARCTLSLLGNGVPRVTQAVKCQGRLDFISQEVLGPAAGHRY